MPRRARNAGHSERFARAQRGQAIVLIALMMVLLLGFVGLALDSGRGYVDRRELQTAVDAAALVAGDVYDSTSSAATASSYAYNAYAANERIGSLGAPSFYSSNPQTYSFPNNPEHSLTIAVTFNGFAGTIFTVSATHRISLSIMQVLGLGSSIGISTAAAAIVGNQRATPALLSLSQGGCGANPGISMQLQGTSAVVVHGDVYSNGSMVMGGSTAFTIGGNAYTNCGGTPGSIKYYCYSPDPNVQPYPPGCRSGDQVGSGNNGAAVIPDPGYPSGNLSWYTNTYGTPGTNTENQPGVWTGFSITGGGGCDWLAPGIYTMQGGFTDHGHQTSNMLKPPDEPVWNNNQVRMSPQFFDTGGCAPATGFMINPPVPVSASVKLNSGTWGVEVTSTRTDYYPPSGRPGATAYGRESAPSMCRTVAISGPSAFTVTISKILGAQGYNIYASPTGCGGPFGFVENIPIATGYGTSVTTGILDSTVITALPGAQCPYTVPASAPTAGCAPPDGEAAPFNSPVSTLTSGLAVGPAYTQVQLVSTLGLTTTGAAVVLATGPNTIQTLTVVAGSTATTLNVGSFVASAAFPAGASTVSITNSLANEDPPRKLLPAGDRANENQCWPQPNGNAAQPCNGSTVTPGAVQFAFPTTNDCLDENGNGGTEIFGGKQYNFITLWFSPANTCSPKLNGGSFTQYIGTMYMPAANLTINGGNKAPVAGQVICYTSYFSGNSGVSIDYNPDTAPAPPSARLIL